MSIDVKDVLDLLSTNNEFVKKIEVAVETIIKDGKLDTSDIPEIVFIITETYNTCNTLKITQNDLPIFIKMIISDVIKRKNLISITNKQEVDKLVDSALKLVMIQPRIQQLIDSPSKCLDCLPCLKYEGGQ